MVLKVIGSSSAGNAYIIEGKDASLMIEAGLPFKHVKRALNWDISKVQGCLISHEHGDHSAFASEVMMSGITVYACKDVLSLTNKSAFFGKELQPLKGYLIGDFKVYVFPVAHDVKCYGFVIEHWEMGRLLFVTDTMMLEYTFHGLNHILLEANYSDRILLDNIQRGVEPEAMKNRLLKSHMELGTAIGILRANDLSKVSEITLIHLSSLNSDSGEFKKAIERETGIPTYIARAGLEVELKQI